MDSSTNKNHQEEQVAVIPPERRGTIMQKEEQRGVAIAKGIRGCSFFFLIPVLSLAAGIVVGQRYGVILGIVSGLLMFGFSFWGAGKLVDRSSSGLTSVDCFLPMAISLISGIVFLPVGLVAGNLFSPATCIFSGILLTVGLWGYKVGKIQSAGWLVLPLLTFLYEILPIDLPTDLDNLLGLSAATVTEVLAFFSNNQTYDSLSYDKASRDGEGDVIDV